MTFSFSCLLGIVLKAKTEKIITEISRKEYLTDFIIKEYSIDPKVYRVNE